VLTVKLNHLNLAVSDVQQARGFLVKYFGLDPEGKRGNDNIAFLRDENGMVLTLTNFERGAEVKYPGAFHIGFIQECRERVDEINQLLRRTDSRSMHLRRSMGAGPSTFVPLAASSSRSSPGCERPPLTDKVSTSTTRHGVSPNESNLLRGGRSRTVGEHDLLEIRSESALSGPGHWRTGAILRCRTSTYSNPEDCGHVPGAGMIGYV
jgi:hypothetical protein